MQQYLNPLRYLACKNRLAWLDTNCNAAFVATSPLHIQHQAIFTILSEQGDERLEQALYDCILYPNMRLACVEEARRLSKEEMHRLSRNLGGSMGNLVTTPQTLTPAAEIARAACAADPGSIFYINPTGFAYFPASALAHDAQFSMGLAQGSRYASYCGVMYYGFTAENNHQSYLQAGSIDVLAKTFASHIEWRDRMRENQPFPYAQALEELWAYASAVPQWRDRIVRDLREFLAGHERGHDAAFEGNRPLLELMRASGVAESVFFQPDTADSDGGAWERICARKGTMADLMFLLSDYLSNMAIMAQGISEPSLRLLRAFNWLRLGLPQGNFRPKGLSAFLVHAYDYNPGRHAHDLQALLRAAQAHPSHIYEIAREFELRFWRDLGKLRAGLPAIS